VLNKRISALLARQSTAQKKTRPKPGLGPGSTMLRSRTPGSEKWSGIGNPTLTDDEASLY